MKPKPNGKLIQQVGKSLKNSSPMILTVFGAVGVVVTAVLVAKETPMAIKRVDIAAKKKLEDTNEPLTKLEVIKAGTPSYIPAVIVGSATIACIFSANILNRRQQASLTSAYALLSKSYTDYKRNVKELYGEEAHRNVLKAMSEEKADQNQVLYAQCLASNPTLDFDTPEEEYLFYDSYGDRHFTSTIGKVLQAQYFLNRNFTLNGNASLNEFYKLLGIAPVNGGDNIGWWVDYENETYWIDFNNYSSEMDDGPDRPPVTCLVIDYPTPKLPPKDYR